MGGPGSGRKPVFDDEYHREHRRRVAVSRKRARERTEREPAEEEIQGKVGGR